MPEPKTKQVRFADCYVLTDQRTTVFLHSFLDAFIPYRKEYTHNYEIPQYAEVPELVLSSAGELITYLEQNGETPHAIYWSNTAEEKLRGGMCIFTTDRQVIIGLTCETEFPDTHIEREYLERLMAYCKSELGFIEYEKPAAQDTKEFLQRFNAYAQ